MIDEITLVDPEEVRNTKSPELQIDDSENETDDAGIPGVGFDGVDPEISIAFYGKDDLNGSSGIDQDEYSQIGTMELEL